MASSLTATSRVQAVIATDEHAEAIATFYREAWGDPVTPDAVRAARQGGDAGPIALVLDGTRVIGHLASIPYRLWDGIAEHPAHWTKGLMVLPEYRNGPVGFLVLKTLTAELSLATALVVAAPARRLFCALGYTDLGAVPNYVRPLRPARLARRLDVTALNPGLPRWATAGLRAAQRVGVAGLAGAAAGVALDTFAAATRRRAATRTTCLPEPPGRDELDALWRDARRTIAAGPVRDGRYLRGRFGTAQYEFVAARDRGRLVGVAVLRRPRAISDPRLRGLRVATISDFVFAAERGDVGLALLGGVERVARAADADAILCTTAQRPLGRLLRRQAYLRLTGNVHFLLRDRSGAGAAHWPQDLASWGLARGDGDADEVF